MEYESTERRKPKLIEKNMNYYPKRAVWEITYMCNMRCLHCGSGCGKPLEDELSTEEAIQVCDDLGKLKTELLTLSGGEPFMRNDWHVIAKRLGDNGVKVNCISNGWYIGKDILKKSKDVGLVNIGISVDGLKDTHDFIRMKGSFERAMASFELMKSEGMPTVACTTVTKLNISELGLIKQMLIQRNVQRWQFQIGRPMGNLSKKPELILSPEEIEGLINFCHDSMREGNISADLADCIGYYSLKDVELRRKSHPGSDGIWRGCGAGKTVIGIRANGNISGCLSLRDDSYIEGNVRAVPLGDLWIRPDAFAWNRNLTPDKLTGFCGDCMYGPVCLGGCSGTKLTMHNCMTRNDHCAFKATVDHEKRRSESINDIDVLISEARKRISSEEYQFADVYLRRVLRMHPDNIEVLRLLGFINYFIGKFDISKEFNKKALKINPDDADALRGYGMCLEKLGKANEALGYLEKAASASLQDNQDIKNDLNYVLKRHVYTMNTETGEDST